MRRTRIVTPGEVVDPSIYEKALREGLKREFPKRQVSKPKKNFSPSKVGFGGGQCPRYWQYHFKGNIEHVDTGDHKSQLKRKVGIDSHATLQALFGPDTGWEYEKKIINQDPPVFGFVDAYDPTYNVPVEIKNVDSSKFNPAKELNTGDSSHVIQTLIYMKILGASQGVLLYVDRTTLDTHAFSVIMNEHHEKYVEGLFKWMQMVRSAFINGEVVERPEGFSQKSFPCTFCPVSEHCWSDNSEPTIQIMRAKGLGY